MNIQPVTAEVASDDRLWHGMASCPCRAGSDRSQATVQVYVQGGGGPGPFTGSRPRVQTGSPPQPPYATLPTDRSADGAKALPERPSAKKETSPKKQTQIKNAGENVSHRRFLFQRRPEPCLAAPYSAAAGMALVSPL